MWLPATEQVCLAIDVTRMCALRTSEEVARAAWALLCALLGRMQGSALLPRTVVPRLREWEDAHCSWHKVSKALDREGVAR